ncbi:preprotein translocase, SecG subunit [Desulfarculus baarsii DSM 2075]|uniref:Protein-export membrane protein SecG n=1 Tax=Desulfarculus baarsii (strain ATCC 33931 / DSM 2075 / LMG 7858 / VKM B-1802 / 2st14) TaxID=644282 RepID=E1QL69_DESB2|nr:preprotein translocase subunit SecG [Desulfarculus baarsii]ADK85334.1 preprotein translocase, SecG subunit [Desulfarculus baarsii DSM 2075]
MQIALILLHLVACAILVLVVLLQTGKGASLGAAFGGASQTVFGSSGAQTFLGKMTTIVAVIFMVTSLTLAITAGGKGSKSVMADVAQPAAQQESAPPAPPKADATAPAPTATDKGVAPAEKPAPQAPAAPAKPAEGK